MWQPEPGWHPIPGGSGTSTLGVWRTVVGDRPVVIKRLGRPGDADPAELSDPEHFAYWRREADVATYGLTDDTPGLIASTTSVDEDADGITLTTDWVEEAPNSGLFVAMSLGRFAVADVRHIRWLAQHQLRDRLQRVERRGGWPTLQRTTIERIARTLWERRESYLDACDALPQVVQHGDPTNANLPGRDDERVVAIDWASLGVGHVGADLGLYALVAREELDPLLDAYVLGLPDGFATSDEALLGARVSAVYTAMSRAEWALARAAGGEGSLEQKYRHPAVAPHLRTLNRLTPSIEALLGE